MARKWWMANFLQPWQVLWSGWTNLCRFDPSNAGICKCGYENRTQRLPKSIMRRICSSRTFECMCRMYAYNEYRNCTRHLLKILEVCSWSVCIDVCAYSRGTNLQHIRTTIFVRNLKIVWPRMDYASWFGFLSDQLVWWQVWSRMRRCGCGENQRGVWRWECQHLYHAFSRNLPSACGTLPSAYDM